MKWRHFRQRKRRDEDLAREIESYVAHEVDDNIARGMSEEEAWYAAQRRFGNATSVREQVYEMNSLSFIESTWKDTWGSPASPKSGVRLFGHPHPGTWHCGDYCHLLNRLWCSPARPSLRPTRSPSRRWVLTARARLPECVCRRRRLFRLAQATAGV